MIQSMTSFARAERSSVSGTLSWELRAVNHRFAEYSVRLPEELRPAEPLVRERLGTRISRGKVDAILRSRPEAGASRSLVLDRSMIHAVLEACAGIELEMDNPERISALEILRWPGVMQPPAVATDKLQADMLALLDAVLDEFVMTREREGGKISELLLQRSEAITRHVQQIRARAPAVLQAQRDRLVARLEELKAEFDRERLEQELVYLAQKLDVNEELDRLDVHVGELQRIVSQSGPAGRRLDFLMQEFNREVNTLASKSADSETTASAVDMKVLVEQMREQIQNIE